MKRIILITIVILTSATTFGQVITKNSMLNFNIGYGNAPLDNYLVFFPGGNVNLSDHHYVFGTEIMGGKNKMLYGVSFNTTIGDTYTGDSIEVEQYTNQYLIDIGYLLAETKGFKLYPVLAIGYGLNTINANNNTDLTIADFGSTAFREINLFQHLLLGQAFINSVFMVNTDKNDPTDTGGLGIGLQIGATYALPLSKWNYNGGKITDGPSQALIMPTAKVVFALHGN